MRLQALDLLGVGLGREMRFGNERKGEASRELGVKLSARKFHHLGCLPGREKCKREIIKKLRASS